MTSLRPPLIGNFKPPRSERIRVRMSRTKTKRASRPGNCEKHLAALRQCPCAATKRWPAGEVHHLKHGTGERGAGMRSSDRWGIPLSHDVHMHVESVGSRCETKALAAHGIRDPIELAAALWAASPNVEKMSAIIMAQSK